MDGTDIVLLPVVIGLVEGAKLLGLPTKFAPPLAIAIAIGFGFLEPYPSIYSIVLEGVIIGLSAVGLYSAGAKEVVEGAKAVVRDLISRV